MESKKRKKIKLTKIVYKRALFFILVILLQLLLLFGVWVFFYKHIVLIFGGSVLFSFFVMIHILNTNENPMYKLGWMVPIFFLPVLGIIIYLLSRLKIIKSKVYKKHKKIIKNTQKYILQDETVMEDIRKIDPFLESMVSYTNNYGGYPMYKNTDITYLKSGEDFFDDMKRELKKAEKFIFLEYFIISDNSMWNEILDILCEKVEQGVEVRVMYDGMGSLFTLPYEYDKYLESLGIKCQIFYPVKPILSLYQNNRDHRKILVVDGKVGYMGGINISDEYINKINRYGHWKDTALLIQGEAVKSLTIMFLQIWDLFQKEKTNYDKYIVDTKCKSEGYIMPYSDSPFDDELVGEEIYLDIINNSVKYVHIVTPYFIIDDNIEESLKHAAKRGVDVKIILPFISDGKSTKLVGYTYYKDLIASGVKIYEYKPGFVHAKMVTSDYDKAVVGTINFDYRSLYLHFECASFIYRHKSIKDIENDIDKILEQSEHITIEKYKKIPFIKKIVGRIMRLFAPLM